MIAIKRHTTADGLQWVADNYGRLQRMCRRLAGGSDRVAEELMDVAIDEVPVIFEAWNPTLSPNFDRYLNWLLRRRLIGKLKACIEERHRSQLAEALDVASDHSDAVDADAVFVALDQLNATEFYVVAARLWYGETFSEIAADIRRDESRTRRIYLQAVARMRQGLRVTESVS